MFVLLRHLVPEFFAQKKLHELSLASWQHFKHTGDNAVRTLSVHTPSQCLGVLDSNVALNDSEDVENSSKPRHRHTRSEGASLPDKKQLSRNKLLQPLPDRSSNVLGSIVDSRPFIGSVSMLRKRIRDTSALPKDHPSARMPLPPQLRDAYERQGRLLDGQLVFDPRGKKESKAHRRGSSLPDHLVCLLLHCLSHCWRIRFHTSSTALAYSCWILMYTCSNALGNCSCVVS